MQCLFLDISTWSTTTHTVQTCRCILTRALPISVAPKNVQNGTRKCPQVMPARSNSGLGICNCRPIEINNQLMHKYCYTKRQRKLFQATSKYRVCLNLPRHRAECRQSPLVWPGCVQPTWHNPIHPAIHNTLHQICHALRQVIICQCTIPALFMLPTVSY